MLSIDPLLNAIFYFVSVQKQEGFLLIEPFFFLTNMRCVTYAKIYCSVLIIHSRTICKMKIVGVVESLF